METVADALETVVAVEPQELSTSSIATPVVPTAKSPVRPTYLLMRLAAALGLMAAAVFILSLLS
jgi:hypothetical protein